MPFGWEVADISDDVRDTVVRLHTFGTDFVVGEGGRAFHTARSSKPGRGVGGISRFGTLWLWVKT